MRYVVIGLFLGACAVTSEKPEPQIGLCTMPPETHEGAYRANCMSENGGTDACCDYLDSAFEPGKICVHRMCTEDCYDWVYTARQCFDSQ